MARVISEKIWHSSKLAKVQPQEWRPEYAWLVAIAYVDGTFEADPRDIWARSYAYSRPDWSAEKVAQLLDEFERVGLLQRITDKDGRVWGFWTGSDNFTPPPSKKSHYKAGKRSLFSPSANKVQPSCTQGEDAVQPSCTPGVLYVPPELESGFESVCELEKESGFDSDFDSASSNTSQIEQPEQVKSSEVSVEFSSLSTVEPKPEDFSSRLEYSKACHAAGALPKPRRVLKDVLPREEFLFVKDREKVAAAVAELAADMAASKAVMEAESKASQDFSIERR
jgi:hypothetical protein